jgi:hypothetical protein
VHIYIRPRGLFTSKLISVTTIPEQPVTQLHSTEARLQIYKLRYSKYLLQAKIYTHVSIGLDICLRSRTVYIYIYITT